VSVLGFGLFAVYRAKTRTILSEPES